jgi:hypothetical protein
MGTPPLSQSVINETFARVEAELRAGFRPYGMTGSGNGAIAEAGRKAVADGFIQTIAAFEGRITRLRQMGAEPDWSLYRPARYQQPVPRQVFHPAPAVPQPVKANGTRVLVIGDLHQNPGQPHRIEVLTLIARYASLHRFERIIQVGDWCSWDSVSAHDRNDTFAGRLKPSIKQDMDNLADSLMAFRRGMDADYKPKLDALQGNHEYRLERWENQHPESVGIHTGQRDELFLQFGWRTRPYGEIFYVDGVGFVHHPVNGAGRAFGGKTGPQRAANDAVCPIVSGHTHRRQIHDSPKIGPTDSISMVEVGCAMPWGELEHYAQHSATGWWWGVVPMTVQDGMITDVQFVSMLTLQALSDVA